MTIAESITIDLRGADETDRLGQWFSPRLGPGDVILLEGPVGASKTHFARAVIQARLAAAGLSEDVPSPTFTLVQTYNADDTVLVHADLYRLSSHDEVHELGLSDGFDTAITLVEWPDRLGPDTPPDSLRLRFQPSADGEARRVTIGPCGPRWAGRIEALCRDWPPT